MPASPETRAMVLVAARICDEKKATDTRILELDPADAGFTDFFLITSATNNRQTGAIADEIELRIKREFGAYAKSVEGRRAGEWILLDYVDFVVHIFTEATREFYDIERLRKSARALDTTEFTAELTAELRQKTEAARRKASGPKAVGSKASGIKSLPAGSAAPIVLAGAATPAKKSAKKTLAKSAAKQAPAKAAAKKAPAKKAPAKSAAKKAAKKSPAKKAPAKKAAKKSAVIVKTAGKPAHAPSVEDTSRRGLPSGASARKQLPPPR